MKTLKTPAALVSMSCYQFALYAGADSKGLDSIDKRFSSMGNYLLAEVPLEGLKHVTKKDLDALAKGQDMAKPLDAKKKAAVMQMLCKEFDLKVKDKGATAYLWGLFRHEEATQMLPEHMWITNGDEIYDTMPGAPIRWQKSKKGLNPPSEAHDVPAGEVASIGLDALTAGHLTILGARDWK
jgi:hypothetical protein